MPFMSYTPEQPTSSEPTPFEQATTLAYDMHRRHQTHNTLELPLISEENGVVVPVISALRFENYPDHEVRIKDTDIILHQRYPFLSARATYVGLWPDGNRGIGVAALYNSELTFRPEEYGGALPFRETMNNLLTGYELVERTNELDIRERHQHQPSPLMGTSTTTLIPQNVGFNSVEKTRSWQPALSGEVTVELAKNGLVKISDNKIWVSDEKIVSLTLAGNEQTIPGSGYHTLPQEAELVLDEKTGEVKISQEGEITSPTPPNTLNPILAEQSKVIVRQAIDQLEWEDITNAHVMRNRGDLSRQLNLSAKTACAKLCMQAIHKLTEARKGLGYELLITEAVVDQLKTLRMDDVSCGGYLVTENYTARDFLA